MKRFKVASCYIRGLALLLEGLNTASSAFVSPLTHTPLVGFEIRELSVVSDEPLAHESGSLVVVCVVDVPTADMFLLGDIRLRASTAEIDILFF
jgi:hypothetical protein